MSVVTSTPFIICLAILGACIFAIVVLDIAGYVPQARELLARQQHTGQHAVKGKRSHVKTGPGPAREDRDPFADLDDGSSDDEEAAAGHFASLRDPGPEGAPALSAPVPQPAPAGTETPAETAPPVAAALEPLPGPPPLEVREHPAVVIAALPEPPVDRGTLDTRREWAAPTADLLARLRDGIRALPGDGKPAAVPDETPAGPGPALPSRKRPVPVPDWLTATGVDAFAPVMLLGDVDGYLDRVFAPAEEALGAAVAEHLGGDGKGEFLGTSLPGLPEDWDFTRPVLALPGGTVAGSGTEEGAA